MKALLLAWQFFIICAKDLPFHACESTFTPKTRGSEPAVLLHQTQPQSTENTIIESNKRSDRGRPTNKGGHDEEVVVVHAKKGAYGGSDILRRPTNTGSAATPSSLPLNPFPILSTLLGHVSIALLVSIFFF